MDDLEKIYSLIEPDEKGKWKKMDLHMYKVFRRDQEPVEYRYYITHQIDVKIPRNVQLIQCIVENNNYWFHMSTSPKYTYTLRQHEREIFDPFLEQMDYDHIRFKQKCTCNFCPYPVVRIC